MESANRPERPGRNHWWGLVAAIPVALLVVVAQLPTPVREAVGNGPPPTPSEFQEFLVQFYLFLSLVPLLLGSFLRPKPVLVLGSSLSLAPLIVYGVQESVFLDLNHVIRIAASVATIAAGVLVSQRRVRTEERLAQVAKVASAVQQAVIRPLPAVLGPVALAAHYESASQEATVGGDFYDAVATPAGVRVLLGDVRGKGIEAVRITNHLLGAFRHRSRDCAPLELVHVLDSAMSEVGGVEDFATAVLLDVTSTDDGIKVTVLNAGHPEPLVLRRGAPEATSEASYSPPLGLGASPAPQTLTLGWDDCILLYTDGLSEARRDGDFLPLSATVGRIGPGTPQHLVDGVRRAVVAWARGDLGDDVALVAVGPARTARV